MEVQTSLGEGHRHRTLRDHISQPRLRLTLWGVGVGGKGLQLEAALPCCRGLLSPAPLTRHRLQQLAGGGKGSCCLMAVTLSSTQISGS